MKSLNWLTAPAEIVDSILSELYHSDFRAFGAFRGASHACKSASDYLFYRQTRLANYKDYECKRRPWNDAVIDRRPWGESQEWTQQVFKTMNILMASDEAARHVRDLAIGPFDAEPFPREGNELLNLLPRLSNLTDFRWEANYQIPSKVLRTLQRVLPDCRLHLSQLTRRDANLDEAMLAQPTLKSLSLVVLEDYHARTSEWPVIDRTLQDLTDLEHLSLMTTGEHSIHTSDVKSWFSEAHSDWPSAFEGPWTLKTPSTDCKLKSLCIGGRVMYERTMEDLRPWVSGMTWSQLTFLDLEQANGLPVLAGLTHRVPQLRTLKLGGPDELYPDGIPQADDDLLKAFLSEVPRLQDLSVLTQESTTWQHFVDTILKCSGANLRSFTAMHSERLWGRGMFWDSSSLGKLRDAAPRLSHLAVEIDPLGATDSLESTCSHEFGPALSAIASTLAKFEKLESLQMRIRMQTSECSSSNCLITEHDLNGLNQTAVKQALDIVFDAALSRNPCSSLGNVELLFRHGHYSKLYWRVRGRRIFDPLPGRGVFAMDVRPSPYLSPGYGHGGQILFDGRFHPEPLGADWFG